MWGVCGNAPYACPWTTGCVGVDGDGGSGRVLMNGAPGVGTPYCAEVFGAAPEVRERGLVGVDGEGGYISRTGQGLLCLGG